MPSWRQEVPALTVRGSASRLAGSHHRQIGHRLRSPRSPDAGACKLMASRPKGLPMEDPSQLAERILEAVADAVVYSARAGTIMRWNRASAALFGFSAEEALGQNLDLIIPEHLRAAH